MPEKSANIDGLEQKAPKNTTGEIHPVGEMKHLHLQRKTFKCRKFAQSLGTPMYWRQLLRRHWGARIPQRPLRRAEKAPPHGTRRHTLCGLCRAGAGGAQRAWWLALDLSGRTGDSESRAGHWAREGERRKQ